MMLPTIPYKTNQFLLALVKIGLVGAAFYYIYTQLFHKSDLQLHEFNANLAKFSLISANTIFFLLILSLLNWFFEVFKWQTLINQDLRISFYQASAQTLGALTASLLTPNRIGDYGAKALYYPRQFRKKIMWLNLIGNSAQMAITTIAGIAGLLFMALQFRFSLNYKLLFLWLGLLAVITLTGIKLLKSNWFRKQALYKRLTFISETSTKIILKALIFSWIRYLIFSFQFYYLLLLFEVDLNYFEAMAIISSLYLLTSIVPSIFIFDVIVKGGVALYLFGNLGVSKTIVLSVVTIMWLLNFVIPSLVGSYHILKFKFPKADS